MSLSTKNEWKIYRKRERERVKERVQVCVGIKNGVTHKNHFNFCYWCAGGKATERRVFFYRKRRVGIGERKQEFENRFEFMEFSAHFRRKYFSSPSNCSAWNCFDFQANIWWWAAFDSINTFLWCIKMRFYTKHFRPFGPDISLACSNSTYSFAITSTLSKDGAVQINHFIRFVLWIVDLNDFFFAISKKKNSTSHRVFSSLFKGALQMCMCVCAQELFFFIEREREY